MAEEGGRDKDFQSWTQVRGPDDTPAPNLTDPQP